jgi:hypothetical protein
VVIGEKVIACLEVLHIILVQFRLPFQVAVLVQTIIVNHQGVWHFLLKPHLEVPHELD